jgi:ribA/ribD-fused uncharacterized protein
MESITPIDRKTLEEFVRIAKHDPQAELECKVLPGLIQTKDVADRIIKQTSARASRIVDEEPYLTASYPDGTRVTVRGTANIQKVCMTNSFRGIPVDVETKAAYIGKNVLDLHEVNVRFTLRKETPKRKDTDKSPADPKAHLRLITRKSFHIDGGLTRVDLSMVKSKTQGVQHVRDILKQTHVYELEVEYVNKSKDITDSDVVGSLMFEAECLLIAYHRTRTLLSQTDMKRYVAEFKASGHEFYDVVTLTRKHVREESPHNIVSGGYTVTIKADGERTGLYVTKDRKLIKIDKTGQITWTGIVAADDSHAGDFIDGEYLPDQDRFCIFDIYQFRKQDVRKLPLMTADDDVSKTPLKSRLGCAHLFVTDDMRKSFSGSWNPEWLMSMRQVSIETKLFMAGYGESMQEAIQKVWSTEYGYKVDGLIFTPRDSAVAPLKERAGRAWLYAYKWKPASQNSIDFLLRISADVSYDTVLGKKVRKGELYVSRDPNKYIVYPRETMNKEYMQKALPKDLQSRASRFRIPSVFQPATPHDENAYQIYLPLNEKDVPVDEDGLKIEDNTIVECAYDTDAHRWSVMRTRYDKTYQYRVLREPQYGNDMKVADSIWTSIHYPVSEYMLTTTLLSNPIDDVTEDMYYSTEVKRPMRIFQDVYGFHLRIKDDMYKSYLHKNDTLLELAVGRGGDLPKWRRIRPSRVVGMDLSLNNLASPIGGAAARYVTELQENPSQTLPPVLFVQGDMTKRPLFDQEDKYMAILRGDHAANTEYLQKFQGLNTFDVVSCQFALHYACETEESFREFAQNVRDACKEGGTLFGTCSDGRSIYSLLLGKRTHHFKLGDQWAGEYTKEYSDVGESDGIPADDTFGMPVTVFLESFEKPAKEYLVPFKKVTEIMKEMGFDLVESKAFKEIYTEQRAVTLTPEEQLFSSLNRTFVFRKRSEVSTQEVEELTQAPAEEIETPDAEAEDVQQVGVPEVDITPPAETPPEPEAPKKRKLRKEKPEPEPILFSGADESKGDYRNFSNMSNHAVEIEGVKYGSVEHYYQAMKATEFKDDEALKKIMKTKTAKAVKAAGKKVDNFNQEVWDTKKDEFMAIGVRSKFVQHPELRTQLLSTEDKQIGFADARDVYWGIGTSMTTEKVKTPSKWRGQNKLGKLLMTLRDEFKDEVATAAAASES